MPSVTYTGIHKEIRSLTGIRGIAASLIMFYHYAEYSAFPSFRPAFLNHAYLAVDLFFVLSGFLLTLRHGGERGSFYSYAAYKDFLRARFARIYPAYAFISVLFYIKWIVNISGTNTMAYNAADFWANIFMVQSWGFLTRPILNDSWSVSVEVFAYLLFPALLIATRKWWAPIGAVLVLVIIEHAAKSFKGPLDISQDSVFPLLRCVADFSLGMICCQNRGRLKKICEKPITLIATLIAIGIAASLKWDIIAVLFITLLIGHLYFNPNSRPFANPIVYQLGCISYSLYLLHPLLLGVAGHFAGKFPGMPPSLFIILGVLSTWGLSLLSYRIIELRAQRWIMQRRSFVKPVQT